MYYNISFAPSKIIFFPRFIYYMYCIWIIITHARMGNEYQVTTGIQQDTNNFNVHILLWQLSKYPSTFTYKRESAIKHL